MPHRRHKRLDPPLLVSPQTMRTEMVMAKKLQPDASNHVVQKAELSLHEAAANQCKDNNYLVALADGRKMQIGTTVTADNYSAAQSLEVNASRLRPLRRDFKVVGHGPNQGCSNDGSRPSPVFIEGKAIDLLQLHTEVITYGGYVKVTENSLWSLISESLGFGQNCGASVKLVYAKYLKILENNNALPKNGVHQNMDCWVAKSVEESSSGMVDSDFTGCASSISPDSSTSHQENSSEMPSKRRRLSYFNASSSYVEYKLLTSTGNNTFVGMVEWLRQVALNPGDPRKGQGPRGSKQNEAWVEECETMVKKARAALWGRKEVIHYGTLTGNMAKQKIPPAVYYKELPKPNTRTLEKLRANQTRAMKCGLHLSGDALDVQAPWLCRTPGQMFGIGSRNNIEPGLHLSSEYLKSMNEALNIGYLLNNNATRKRIPIGGDFQAQVPPWMGKVQKEREDSCSDEQSCGFPREMFGGVHVWPLSDREITSDIVRVGKGRSLQCKCQKPMSIGCVRMHVVEERERLKGELGDAFNSWGFDEMGEFVSARWTDKEEDAFDATVRSNPSSLGKNFWDELPAALPLKTVKETVSYYFNVFVVRRRAIENRIMPDSIDSDDDERELVISENYCNFGKTTRVDFGKRVGLMPNWAFHHEAPGTV